MTDERHKGGPSLTDLRKLHHQTPRWVIVLVAAGVAAAVASRIPHLLMTLIIAAIIAYILSSAVSVLERLGIKRSVAVVQLFVVAGALTLLADMIFVPDLKREMMNAYAKLPEFPKRIEGALLLSNSVQASPMIGSGVRKLVDHVFGPGGFLEKTFNSSELLMQATPFIMGLILVPFFAFFMLKDWPRVTRRVMEWIPPSYVETTVSVMTEVNILVGKYLRGLAADCFFVGVLASLGLWLVGINYPIILGIVSGVANVVPYLGPIVGCSVSSVVALMQYNSLDPVLNVVILYLVIKLMDDLVIQPLMIGKSVHMHPLLLVITLIVGEKLFGISGMILGVPVVTAVQKTAGILLERRREIMRRESSERLIAHRMGKIPVRPI